MTLELEAASWTFEAGHRIRLDLAGTDWPNVWSPPEPVTLTIDRSATTLDASGARRSLARSGSAGVRAAAA